MQRDVGLRVGPSGLGSDRPAARVSLEEVVLDLENRRLSGGEAARAQRGLEVDEPQPEAFGEREMQPAGIRHHQGQRPGGIDPAGLDPRDEIDAEEEAPQLGGRRRRGCERLDDAELPFGVPSSHFDLMR